MTKLAKVLLLLLTYLIGITPLGGQSLVDQLSDEARISVLVASPVDDEVYTVYGHVGLQVRDPKQGIDVVFNYGIFSFTDDFAYRFIKGQTDYMVVPQPTYSYVDEYLGRGSDITDLELNLDSAERMRVWTYLLDNIKPENREYRYKFFLDNCSTRPLYIVEQAVGGLVIPDSLPGVQARSWREEINELEAKQPWLVLSTDLLLGSPTDSMMSVRESAFSPRYLEGILWESKKLNGEPLLSNVTQHMPECTVENSASLPLWQVPWCYALLLFLFVAWLMGYRVIYKRQTVPLLLDAIGFGLAGLGGCVIFYVAILSEHQFVSPNYNLWVLHPLHLLLAVPLMCISSWRGLLVCYHFANFVAITVFMLVAYCLPQHFNVALYIIALSLSLTSLARIIEYRRARV